MKDKARRGWFLFLILFFAIAGCDSNGDSDSGKNYPPEIISSPNTSAVTDETYSYIVKAIDQDNDLLTYELKSFPKGMTINSITGEIKWTPTYKQVGNHWIELRVKDREASDSQKFAIRVSPVDNGVAFQRGFTLVSWWNDDYLQPQTENTLRQMKKDGCEWVSILVTQYVDTTDSPFIHPTVQTPSDKALIHAIKTAQALGMNVVLKPHIDVLTGDWRGNISFENEADWQTWFQNYNEFLGHYLELAEAHNVKIVIIGTELKKTENRESDWRNTIALARTKFSGQLTYDTNWDSLYVQWWDALDFIGFSAYFPLTDSYSPTVEELKSAWASNIEPYLRALSAFWEKDIVFLEIGYQSFDGANTRPYGAPTTTPDLQEQADCYRAALESVYNEEWFKGMYWWAWYWDPTLDIMGYDIYHKPAEDIIRKWYAGY